MVLSEEKLEPRLGNRFKEDGIEFYEQPLQPGRDIGCGDLSKWEHSKVLRISYKYPQHRHIIHGCQIVFDNPYAEIR